MKKTSKKKSNQYSCRIDAELQEDFEECLRVTGMDPALLLRECLRAFVEEVKSTGEIRFPLAIVAKTKNSGKLPILGRPSIPPLSTDASPGSSDCRLNETPPAQ